MSTPLTHTTCIRQAPPAPTASVESSVHPSASIEDALSWVCERLGRPVGEAERELIGRLKTNWYDSAGAVAGMSETEAETLRVPARLLAHLRQHLRDSSAPEESELRASPPSHEWEGQDAAARGTGAVEVDVGLSQSAATVELAADIMLRRCPPPNRNRQLRSGGLTTESVRVTKRSRGTPYALKTAEASESLQAEMDSFFRFCTTRFFGAQRQPIAEVTAAKYLDHIRGMLGWLHRVRGIPLADLSFKTMICSPDRSGVAVAFEYLQWLRTSRQTSVRTEGLAVRSLQAVAQFMYHDLSQAQPHEGEKPYGDLLVVRELRRLANEAKKEAKVAARVADESIKWLDWPEYLALVQDLRRECAGLDSRGRPRNRADVAWSLQRYLIFAILACIPDRQRTLRELQVGKTLFREGQHWIIRHGARDYKTGKVYGERPPMVISPQLYPELEAFLETWRAELNPQHEYLFTRKDGTKPFTDSELYKLFWMTSYRLTGRRLNPHMVRDSVVTYLRSGNATERQLEALAIYMGHSVAEQRQTYDRRTMQQKVSPAVELLAELNSRGLKTKL